MKRNKFGRGFPLVTVVTTLSFINTVLAQSESKEIALLWIQTPSQLSEIERRQAEHELLIDLENKQGRKVMRHPFNYPIPLEAYKNVQSSLQLQDVSQKLWELVLKTEPSFPRLHKNQGDKLVQTQLKIMAHLTRGAFGPEIQEAKITQAAWELLLGNKNKSVKLIQEASDLHPQGEIVWNKESSSAFGHVFESMLIKSSYQTPRAECYLHQPEELHLTTYPVWINGFRINKKLESVRKGRYLINKVSFPQKEIFEELLICQGKDLQWGDLRWTQIKMGIRREQWLITTDSKGDEIILLFPQQKKITRLWSSQGRKFKIFEAQNWDLGLSLPLVKEEAWKLQQAPLQKKQDLGRSSRLSLLGIVAGVALAIGLAYGLKPRGDSAEIPVVFTRE